MGDEFKWLFIGCSNNFLMTVMKFRFAWKAGNVLTS
jgi:hypothetical protein